MLKQRPLRFHAAFPPWDAGGRWEEGEGVRIHKKPQPVGRCGGDKRRNYLRKEKERVSLFFLRKSPKASVCIQVTKTLRERGYYDSSLSREKTETE